MTREEALAETTRQLENARNTLKISKNKAVLTATANKIDYLVAVQATLRPVSREQVEKVWRGEWNYSHKTKIDGFDVVQCSKCGQEALTLALYVKNGNFCPYCGAPMTDEAVEMVMERMNKLYD